MAKRDKHYDVLIIGAGPAGSTCATMLAQQGFSVGLVDKSGFPRDKVCGDALSLDVVNQLPKVSPDLASEFHQLSTKMPSYGVTIGAPNEKTVQVPFYYQGEPDCGYLLPRYDFDNLLYQHAARYDAVDSFLESPVTHIAQSADGVQVSTRHEELRGTAIVGADGANSVVNRYLGTNTMERSAHSAGLRVYYEGVQHFSEGQYIELYFFKDILPGYLWVFPLTNNRANVGIGVLSSAINRHKLNLKAKIHELLTEHPSLKDRFANARALEKPKGMGLPLGSKERQLSGAHFLLTGDAAGLIDPFSGEGIGNAIRSGRTAANRLAEAFREQDFSATFLRQYDQRIYGQMKKEFKVSHTIQRLSAYPWIFNFVTNKARQSQSLRLYLSKALEHVDHKQVLTKPRFYWQLLRGRA